MQDTIFILGQDLPLMSLIARTLRCQQVFCKLLPIDMPAGEILSLHPKGLILAAEQVVREGAKMPDLALLTAGVPVLALGDFAAKLCAHFGGEVMESLPEGQAVTFGLSENPLFTEITGGERMLHGVECLSLPEPLLPIATATERCIGFQHRELPLYGLQYPIEHNDPDAAQLLNNFACLICGAEANWSEDVIIQRAVSVIREAAGEGHVLCAVSGGVDSAVCAKLAHMAVGDQLTCVFMDTGFFRAKETEEILQAYQELMGISVKPLDVKARFMKAMAGVRGAGEKESRATSLLHQIMLEEREKTPVAHTLLLGTNFSDRLYSVSPELSNIQSVACQADYCVVEPVIGLFKEEVRRLATTLSLPVSISERQPFPSGGLALRILGEVTEEKLRVLRAADGIFREEIREGGHEKRLWQHYAALAETEVDSGYAVILRALQAAQQGAYAARLPYDALERVTQRILSQVSEVSRVIYDLTPSMHYREQE